MTMHSNLGCGTLEYLVLTANPTVFTLQENTPFIEPLYPGATPVIMNPAPTTALIGVIIREHTADLRVFIEYHNVDRVYKK